MSHNNMKIIQLISEHDLQCFHCTFRRPTFLGFSSNRELKYVTSKTSRKINNSKQESESQVKNKSFLRILCRPVKTYIILTSSIRIKNVSSRQPIRWT